MPTNSEKIDELIRLVTQLVSRIDRIEEELKWASEWVEKLRGADANSQQRLTLLERESGDWKKTSEEWGRRAWTAAIAVVSLIVGGVITYLAKR